MLKLVRLNGEPVGPNAERAIRSEPALSAEACPRLPAKGKRSEPAGQGAGRGRVARPARRFAAQRETSAAKLDCGVEISASIAVHLVEGLMRAGAATDGQAEMILAHVAEGMDALVAGAPDNLRDTPEWECLRGRLSASAAMIRARIFDIEMSGA